MLETRKALESLAMPMDADQKLAALTADFCWRHGKSAIHPGIKQRAPKHYASAFKAAAAARAAHISAARQVLDPVAAFARSGRPETPARADVWASLLATAAAVGETDLLADASRSLARHPEDVARVHLRALEASYAFAGADAAANDDDDDDDDTKAARSAVHKLATTLAKALDAAYADDEDGRADALHALLHEGLDSALANAPKNLGFLAALSPYLRLLDPKKKRAKHDARLKDSLKDAFGDSPVFSFFLVSSSDAPRA